MALSTFVKVSGITNLSDARYCAGMSVDLLGFALESNSEKYVSPKEFGEITGWISGLEFVGEFGDARSVDIETQLKEYPTITWVEHDRLEPLSELEGKGIGLIYKMELNDVRNIELDLAIKLNSFGIIFHVISKHEDLRAEDLEMISKLSEHCKVILGVGITSSNVVNLVKELNLYGISLDGGSEIKPGLKDFDEMADILESLEIKD
jgi:phosphoribosylanthranilate isomerase